MVQPARHDGHQPAAAAGPASMPASAAAEEPWTAVLLVSSLSADWDVRCGQRDALNELFTRRIPVEDSEEISSTLTVALF